MQLYNKPLSISSISLCASVCFFYCVHETISLVFCVVILLWHMRTHSLIYVTHHHSSVLKKLHSFTPEPYLYLSLLHIPSAVSHLWITSLTHHPSWLCPFFLVSCLFLYLKWNLQLKSYLMCLRSSEDTFLSHVILTDPNFCHGHFSG